MAKRDDRHQRRSRRDAGPDLYAPFGYVSAYRCDDGGAGKFQISFLDFRRRCHHPWMGFDRSVVHQHLGAGALCPGLADRGAGLFNGCPDTVALRNGGVQRGLCRLQGFGGNIFLAEKGLASGVFLLGATYLGFHAFDFGTGALQVGRALCDQCLRLVVVRVEAAHRPHCVGQIRLGQLQLYLGIGGIELHQRLALLDQVGVIGRDADDCAGNLRGDLDNIAPNVGVIGGHVPAPVNEPIATCADGDR